MKDQIRQLLESRLRELAAAGQLPEVPAPAFAVDPPRNPDHGDLSTNLAMLLAKPARRPPLEVAKLLVEGMALPTFVAQVETVAPGFINFRLRSAALLDALETILNRGEAFGESDAGAGQSIQIEFVSANPTGPLHVGHGRGAAYGSALARLLRATGVDVQTEYYVNDAGRQMDILALSVWVRYLQAQGVAVALPENAYQGAYVRDIAAALVVRDGKTYLPATVPAFPELQDAEARLDATIACCRAALGEPGYRTLHGFACDAILQGIREDLVAFGVNFDRWYSERSLLDGGKLQQAVAELRERGYLVEREGAQWFASTRFGDEKDRVVVRENGVATYFASDIAYHAEKYTRGFTRLINIWGADHHGYIPRVRGALTALGLDASRLEVLLVQFATLYRSGERVQMSTRSGEFVTLAELMEEVGADAARYFYIMRRSEQHLDFDLDLAKSQSQDNPVYYLQYAHARICSVLRQAAQQGSPLDLAAGLRARERLVEKRETALAALAGRFPEVISEAARDREPHQVANFLRELAMEFHGYYNAHKILVEDTELRSARLALCAAVRVVMANGLRLLGVSAPEEM